MPHLYGRMAEAHAHASPIPSKPAVSAVPSATSSPAPSIPPRTSSGVLHRLRFRPSPFYEMLEYVSSIVQVPEAPPPSGRRQVVVAFTLSQKQRELLQDTPKRFQLRLFCTTFEHYMASITTGHNAPVEFPFTCEARVNEKPLGVSLKGSKKHPGRVSPPDVNRNGSLLLLPGRLNRVEIAYANAPSLQQRQIRTKDEVLSKMQQQALDEEIVTGAFYSLNEQSPQWLCPVCNQTVQSEQLRLDGYVEDILQRVPSDIDTVLVESDGSWHTADGKYTDASPILHEPPRTAPPKPEESADSVDLGDFVMDEDDLLTDGAPTVHDPVLGSDLPTSPPAPAPAEHATDVIDLTFDSDDE
ncbi:hypothetical protein MOBT1_000668 [Malassezia obtusa]|uniref:PINIT domain-containing protein n=1 Tax=Malassezia obtusa TaxID=76774 RepID=A0AAF0IQW3_9BASI|nr:hypothetical protein MOBT1_000668 [Malassezia obtusa]